MCLLFDHINDVPKVCGKCTTLRKCLLWVNDDDDDDNNNGGGGGGGVDSILFIRKNEHEIRNAASKAQEEN